MPLLRHVRIISAALICVPWFAACSAGPDDAGGADRDGDGASATGGSRSDYDDVSFGGSCTDCVGPAVCGDGILSGTEACDDGDTADDDGCSADCATIETGFICPTPGEACRPFVRCGDGVVTFPEQCDDGNEIANDGCSPRCKIELNTKCSGSPSVCEPTVCGDGIREGTEGCDFGDTIPFDGCSETCQVEPSCGDDGCTSSCGDGVVLDEECDDGNTVDNDGCSSTCMIEPGSICTSAPCETVGDKCIMRIPVIYRDFLETHSDFQPGCHSEVEITGIVQATLGADGKPRLVTQNFPGNTCISQFPDWYNEVSGVNSLIVGQILLFEDGNGGYVNRWKDDGTQFTSLTSQLKDGQPFFFPIDNHPSAITPLAQYATATVGTEYSGTAGYTGEASWVSPAPQHNFHFTSQVQYWFRYDASAVASLAFTGDDDVWVFINGRLAVDLGGLHVPRPGSVAISAATASTYGLEDGKVYPISIFHAERKKDGSSFRLTLSGLSMGRSECVSDCGDGIIGPDEECDDGFNVGGYNQCQPDCRLGGFCGDGIKQPEEVCDFRAEGAPSECNSGCKLNVVR